MKKILILIVFTSYFGYSQVGVGTTAPDSTLDIVAANPTGASTNVDGILIPRVDRQRAQSMTGVVTSTMIYVNSIATGTAAGTTANMTSTGFYFYDGAVWQKITTGTTTNWSLTGNGSTTAGTNFIGTTDGVDVRIKTGGNDRWNISDTNNGQLQSYSLGTAALPNYSFQGDTNTGLFSSGADNLDLSTGGTARIRIPNANQLHALSLGTAALPFYSFSADSDTGLFSSAANNLDLSTGGTARIRIPNANQIHALSLGTAALPFYTFSAQTTTGIFGAATDILGFSTAGTEKARFLSTGQLGIGTTTPQGILDITSTTNGILVPRVSLSDIITASPVVNPQGGALVAGTLVWNTATAGTFPNNVIPGFYYWNGTIWISVTGAAANSWSLTGNGGTNGGTTVLAGTNFIGTVDSQNMDIRTNNTFRGRFSALGEFLLGTLNTATVGDLNSTVSNATFPFALNGYSAFNGSGVYGLISSGNTIYGGVQGEYNGTGTTGTGVRGIHLSTATGTSLASVASGVAGDATTSGSYKFGVYGNGGTSLRSGGVYGYNYGYNGALGYYAANGNDYDVYGFGIAYTTGSITGRSTTNSLKKDTNIGLGIYGGFMGGWVRGFKYGFHTKGEIYSLYMDGNGYTNKPLTYLINTENRNRTPSFMSTSMQPEVSVNGKSLLENGKVFIHFDKNFASIISNIDDLIITATPQGKSNGVYIDEITKNGFYIIENNNGKSNVKIAWIAVTKIKDEENPIVPEDLLANDFDKKMDGVMFNDNNTKDIPQSIWWDGTKIRWDKPEETKTPPKDKSERPKN